VDAPPATSSAPSRSKKASSAATRLQTAETAASRSRSTSAKPKVDVEEEATELDQDQEDDDRLYCICQRRWDENSVMIGCDVYVGSLRFACRTLT
jgi:COMPASS component SPP1